MKNAINYYYNLVTYDIRRSGNVYRFMVDNDKYLLINYDYNVEEASEIYKLDMFLLQMKVFVHQIILNNTNNIITYINSEPYILMKILISEDRKININDLFIFKNIPLYNCFKKLEKNNWRLFWINKIDYFEYQIREMGVNYPLLRESFNYFVGITETAISLLFDFKYKGILSVSHRRVNSISTLLDLYNPLNLIIDSPVRDACEYFKSEFFYNNLELSDIKKYLTSSNLSKEDIYLFYVRMLYPSFYFDLYEKIIDGIIKEQELLKIINKIEKYQVLLKDLYWVIKNYVELPNIEWIIKT